MLVDEKTDEVLVDAEAVRLAEATSTNEWLEKYSEVMDEWDLEGLREWDDVMELIDEKDDSF